MDTLGNQHLLTNRTIHNSSFDITMISKSIIHKLFVILAESKYRFTTDITSHFLSCANPNEKLVYGPTTKLNSSWTNERVKSLVQVLE